MADPTRVVIAAIDVDATIVPLGISSDGSLEVPGDPDDAGWSRNGPEPGEAGAAVIAGHVDSTTGPAVFYRLRQLEPGDRVVVHDRDGRSVSFRVERVAQYAKDDFPTTEVYGRTDEPTLRLITCGGQFDRSSRHYVDNVVAYASLVS